MKLLDWAAGVFKKGTSDYGGRAFTTDNGVTEQKMTQYLNEARGWVGVCVDALSEAVAIIDLKLYKTVGDGVEEVTDHPVLNLLYNLNDEHTTFDHFLLTQTFLELTGEAPWFFERNSKTGAIENIYLLQPDRLTRRVNKDKTVFYQYQGDGGNMINIPKNDILLLKYPNPATPMKGKGTLEKAALTVDIDRASEEWNKKFYENSARPDSVLIIGNSERMTDQQKEELKSSIRSSYGSIKNSHKTMVLTGDMKFEKVGTSQKDMDFMEQQKFSRDKIFGLFRVPKSILSQTDGVNYSNAKTGAQVFIRHTIEPKMERLVQQLNKFLLDDFVGTEEMFLHFENPVPEDRLVIFKLYDNAMKHGYMTRNEIRKLEGLKAQPNCDDIYIAQNMVKIGQTAPSAGQNTPVDDKPVDDEKKYTISKSVLSRRVLQMKARNPIYFKAKSDAVNVEATLANVISTKIKKQITTKKEKELKLKEEAEMIRPEWLDEDKTIYFDTKEAIRSEHEDNINEQKVELYDEQIDEVLAKLKTIKKLKTVEEDIEEYYEILRLEEIEQEVKITEKIGPALLLLYLISANATLKLVGSDVRITDTSEGVQDAVNEKIHHLAESTTQTTNNKLKDAISSVLKDGGKKKELKEAILKTLENKNDYRSRRIAETESTRFEAIATERAFVLAGNVEGKEWYANPGACQFCRPLHGKSVKLGKSFKSKGTSMEGEDGGVMELNYETIYTPPLHSNCKCKLVPLFAKVKKAGFVKKGFVQVTVDSNRKEYVGKIAELEETQLKVEAEFKALEDEKIELQKFREKIAEEYNNQQDGK